MRSVSPRSVPLFLSLFLIGAAAATGCISDTGNPDGGNLDDGGSLDDGGNVSDGGNLNDGGNVSDGGNPSGHTSVELSAGGAHSCEVREDKSLWCWGDGTYGQLGSYAASEPRRVSGEPRPVPVDGEWLSVSAGYLNSCALRADHTLWCWGSWAGAAQPQMAPLQIGTDADWSQISAGGGLYRVGFTCGLRSNGTGWCFGQNDVGQLGRGTVTANATLGQLGADTDWSTISSGEAHGCGLKQDGSLWCWGGNDQGALGVTDLSHSPSPIQIGSATDWTSVSAGMRSTCARKTSGEVWCWGRLTGNPTPAVQFGGEQFESVTVGGLMLCAVKANGSAWCLGSNPHGEQGMGTNRIIYEPGPVGGPAGWASLTAGTYHACGLKTDGSRWCWGWNKNGQLGNGRTANSPLPVPMVDTSSWTQVSAGPTETSCGVKADGTLWCWGALEEPSVPDLAPAAQEPVQVVFDSQWAQVAVGAMHRCARKTTGALGCWGIGSLGEGSYSGYSPKFVSGNWSDVATGMNHTCGIKSDGTAWCWGPNPDGQLGNSSSTIQLFPFKVGTDTDWSQIRAGVTLTCAIKTNGSLWCWGDGNFTPTQVGTDTNWSQLSLGQRHRCAVKTDGSLWCWGDNSSLQSGVASPATLSAPTQVGTDNDWSSVSTGDRHSCAVKGGTALWCWGLNDQGQLGFVDSAPYPFMYLPTQVGSGTSWTQVSVGGIHTLALTASGAAQAWGHNAHGQLGDGAAWATLPIAVH